MISFWTDRRGSVNGIGGYREHRGRAIAERLRVCLYEDIGVELRCSAGAQIFSGLDQLTDVQRDAVAAIWDEHARLAPGSPRLNDPRRVLLRFPLLTALHEQGLNSFRVYRATDVGDVRRFPVFVRGMNDHYGALTGLLSSRWDVVRALGALRLRGYALDGLMVVEFCDTSRADGVFRKYAAFKVGDRILPCHAFASRRWLLKSDQKELTEAGIRDEIAYMETNPHEDRLRRVFSIAGTDYGRVDYGVLDGVPQVWEINLNPTLGRRLGSRYASLAPDLRRLRENAREAFHARLRDAFVALDGGHDDREVHVPVGPELLARIAAGKARDRRRQRSVDRLRGLYEHPRLGRPFRAVYSTLFPRR
jgi:hypothetical protein